MASGIYISIHLIGRTEHRQAGICGRQYVQVCIIAGCVRRPEITNGGDGFMVFSNE